MQMTLRYLLLRRMLEMCNKYAEEFSISFNANKSKCIVFRTVGKQTNEILSISY